MIGTLHFEVLVPQIMSFCLSFSSCMCRESTFDRRTFGVWEEMLSVTIFYMYFDPVFLIGLCNRLFSIYFFTNGFRFKDQIQNDFKKVPSLLLIDFDISILFICVDFLHDEYTSWNKSLVGVVQVHFSYVIYVSYPPEFMFPTRKNVIEGPSMLF